MIGRCVIKKNDFVLKDKKSIFIDKKVVIGKNVIIYENNRIEGNTVIDDNVTIFPNSYILSSKINKGSKIWTSVIENSKIGKCCSVGPFSHLKKSKLNDQVKVGAFCEIKNTEIKEGVVVSAGTIMIEENFKIWFHWWQGFLILQKKAGKSVFFYCN